LLTSYIDILRQKTEFDLVWYVSELFTLTMTMTSDFTDLRQVERVTITSSEVNLRLALRWGI